MTENLTHQLAALEDAWQQVQRRAGDDPKVSELVLCARSLLLRLGLDRTLGPQLADIARERFERLKLESPLLADLTIADTDVPVLLRAAHAALVGNDSADAAALRLELVRIEAESAEAFEKAYRAALPIATPAGGPANATKYDQQALAEFLSKSAFGGAPVTVDAIDLLSGGFSKQTLRAKLSGGDDIPDALVLRVDLPKSTALSGTDVADEFPVLETLYHRGVAVPRPYAIEPSGDVIGRPFMAVASENGRTLGTLFEFPAPIPEVGRQLARQLAAIHTVPEAVIRPKLAGEQAPTIDRIKGEIDRSYQVWTSLGRNSTIIEEGFRFLRAHVARAEGRRTLVHGDIGLHNMLVEGDKVTAILDWEFAKLGNPADDLGYAYDTADHMLGWDAFATEYEMAGGILPPRDQLDFYRLLGLVRIVVYIHQADAGFVSGAFPLIQYALPGNLYLRGVLRRIARLLEDLA